MFFLPFPLMENEAKRSSAIRSSNRRMAQTTAPQSDVGQSQLNSRRQMGYMKIL